MTMKSVMLQFSEDQLSRLDREARQRGSSRAQVVREAVDAHFEARPDPNVAQRYAAAYSADAASVDEWGDVDAWHEAAALDREPAERGEW